MKVFTISDETNEEQDVEVLATMTLEDHQYVAVSFVEDLKRENDEDIKGFLFKGGRGWRFLRN